MGLDWTILQASAAGDAPVENKGMVSCICLTRGWYRHLGRAIACFDAQTYKNRELIVVYETLDGEAATVVPRRGDIVWLQLPKLSIGMKRNIALSKAKGKYFATWDDDDWHSPYRLARQVASLSAHKNRFANMSLRELIYDEEEEQLYLSTRRAQENTLLCDTAIPMMIQWPDISLGEDTALVRQILWHDWADLIEVPELYIYVFHGRNMWGPEHHRSSGVRESWLPRQDAERIAALLDFRRRGNG